MNCQPIQEKGPGTPRWHHYTGAARTPRVHPKNLMGKLSNSPNEYCMKCMETAKENLHADIYKGQFMSLPLHTSSAKAK